MNAMRCHLKTNWNCQRTV